MPTKIPGQKLGQTLLREMHAEVTERAASVQDLGFGWALKIYEDGGDRILWLDRQNGWSDKPAAWLPENVPVDRVYAAAFLALWLMGRGVPPEMASEQTARAMGY